MKHIEKVTGAFLLISILGITGCSTDKGYSGEWEYQLSDQFGTMQLQKAGGGYNGKLISVETGEVPFTELKIEGDSLAGKMSIEDKLVSLSGKFNANFFEGRMIRESDTISFRAEKINIVYGPRQHQNIKYTLHDSALSDYESNLDHASLIKGFDEKAMTRGARIYNSNCINCHGTPDVEGSIPLSLKFWKDSFKAGNDPYSMYLTLTKGYESMPPQVTLTPQEKYDVIGYIRENYIRPENRDQYYHVSKEYLADLPEGAEKGPEVKPYHPWLDMDYGNFFINTYELADEKTGIPRYHSPGPPPFADENYLKNNFAYKGIAVRLDEGEGGISDGRAWMIFDHDLMRVAGGWTGKGFIDWEGILLNDRHETYPRTIGRLHFDTPVEPAWANPATGSFNDPRFKARDGRRFGPLPNKWASYLGLYHHGDQVVVSYTVGDARILEHMDMLAVGGDTVFTRTLNISRGSGLLKMRVAGDTVPVAIKGSGAKLSSSGGYVTLDVVQNTSAIITLFIAKPGTKNLTQLANSAAAPQDLTQYTKGGPAHYPEEMTTSVNLGNENGPIAVDELIPPFDNPWKSRMKLSGIDFMKDPNVGVACTTDGDIWLIRGLLDPGNKLTWKRIGSGLFQPLGIKVVDEKIYVTCRDQLVRLQDFNGDMETDFYESFNHDHQVTDHFHEFAMGLQTDRAGNFYYAKSGRHAREALIPQHGTLLKVSKDGSSTKIIAKGFRAANGVCINPDGSFIVTDQQGYWNPMNRVNWVDWSSGQQPKFFGNMWGYQPPADSSKTGMEQPIVWIDMEFDRSPSELLWVDSEKWGPLNRSLLSFSYGYGKIQLVLPEKINNQRQAGIIDLPGVKFLSGVMRGRFNPADGNLYACGMSAWGTSQVMRGGEFYRLRYTGKHLPIPVKLSAKKNGLQLEFAAPLDPGSVIRDSIDVMAWDLLRSSKYGSDRHNIRSLRVSNVSLSEDGRSLNIFVPEIAPVDVMTIKYELKDLQGNIYKGTVQNTIHNLKGELKAKGEQN